LRRLVLFEARRAKNKYNAGKLFGVSLLFFASILFCIFNELYFINCNVEPRPTNNNDVNSFFWIHPEKKNEAH
jgi:hypothetical protein